MCRARTIIVYIECGAVCIESSAMRATDWRNEWKKTYNVWLVFKSSVCGAYFELMLMYPFDCVSNFNETKIVNSLVESRMAWNPVICMHLRLISANGIRANKRRQHRVAVLPRSACSDSPATMDAQRTNQINKNNDFAIWQSMPNKLLLSIYVFTIVFVCVSTRVVPSAVPKCPCTSYIVLCGLRFRIIDWIDSIEMKNDGNIIGSIINNANTRHSAQRRHIWMCEKVLYATAQCTGSPNRSTEQSKKKEKTFSFSMGAPSKFRNSIEWCTIAVICRVNRTHPYP